MWITWQALTFHPAIGRLPCGLPDTTFPALSCQIVTERLSLKFNGATYAIAVNLRVCIAETSIGVKRPLEIESRHIRHGLRFDDLPDRVIFSDLRFFCLRGGKCRKEVKQGF